MPVSNWHSLMLDFWGQVIGAWQPKAMKKINALARLRPYKYSKHLRQVMTGLLRGVNDGEVPSARRGMRIGGSLGDVDSHWCG